MQVSQTTLRSTVASGMLWATFGTVLSKLASFIAQLVLGWVLSSEDFGLYAIVISWSTIALALRNGGTQRLLIQQGGHFSKNADPFFRIALIFNLFALVLLSGIAPVLANWYDSPRLKYMMWVVAISVPLNTASLFFQAKLSATLAFPILTKLTSWSAFLRHSSSVLFALMGLGPMSFVLPLVVITAFETIAGWYCAGGWPIKNDLNWRLFRDVFQRTRWIILTTFASALVVNGDYLALSLFQSNEVLGIYYFGFQLSLSLAALFTNSIDGVMLPAFSHFTDTERQTTAFFKSVRLLTVVMTFACFGLFLIADDLIHMLWAGKWDSAIIVVQVLTLSLPMKVLTPLCRSLLEARGEWTVVAKLLLTDGIGTVLAGAIGGFYGGLDAIAYVVGSYNFVYGLCCFGFITRKIGGRLVEAFKPVVATFTFGIVATLVGLMVLHSGMTDRTAFWPIATLLVIYSAVYLALLNFLQRDSFVEAISMAVGKKLAQNYQAVVGIVPKQKNI